MDKVKIERLLSGEKVICSDQELNSLVDFNWSNSIASILNPNQIGTKDNYIAWIKPGIKLTRPRLEYPFSTMGARDRLVCN